jgi:hypothetical protein
MMYDVRQIYKYMQVGKLDPVHFLIRDLGNSGGLL